jgi:copper transporter 1
MCQDMLMSDCTPWINMCKAIGDSKAGLFCLPLSQRPDTTTTSTSTSTSTSSASKEPCIADSTAASCASYQYPDALASADLAALCASMPDMSGCSLGEACKAGKLAGAPCKPFSLLGSICATDMPTMRACANYAALCSKSGSTVQQCTSQAPMARLPRSEATRKAVLSACSDHTMPSCSKCSSLTACPDPLLAYSDVCREHPTMSQCATYQTWCSAASVDASYFCDAGSADLLPPMQMYFHQRLDDIVLFRSWIPRSGGAYAGTIIAIIAFGMLSSFLKSARGRLDSRWVHDSLCKANAAAAAAAAQSCCGSSDGSEGEDLHWIRRTFRKHPWSQNSIRALLTGITLTLDYFNMLIVMTFNVGLFIAVVCGYVLGTLFFSHLVVPTKKVVDDTGAAFIKALDESADKGVEGKGVSSATLQHKAAQETVLANSHCECC